MNNDETWMRVAISLAEKAESMGEVPVGAVVVANNQIIGQGFNQPIRANDPCAHAEILAIRQAASHINNYRLVKTTLYVTLEPCVMCAGAMIHARIERLMFGAFDPKSGAAGSVLDLMQVPSLNHRIVAQGGLLEESCGDLLRSFFRKKRMSQRDRDQKSGD